MEYRKDFGKNIVLIDGVKSESPTSFGNRAFAKGIPSGQGIPRLSRSEARHATHQPCANHHFMSGSLYTERP